MTDVAYQEQPVLGATNAARVTVNGYAVTLPVLLSSR